MSVVNLPRQKLKTSSKTKAWGKKNFEAINKVILDDKHPFRTSLKQKSRNIRSYNGDIGIEDYNIVLNPDGLNKEFIPNQIQHIPIAVPYLNVLIGEEAERKFDFRAVAINPTTISAIQEQKNELLKQKIYELLQDHDMDDKEAMNKFKDYLRYLKYSYQDVREQRINLLLKYHIKELDLKLKFNEGFKYVTLVAEEAYYGDVVNGKPIIEVINPKNIFALNSGDSNRIEDSDIIIISRYRSPNQLLDKYSQYLKPSEVDKLDKVGGKSVGVYDNSEQLKAARKDAFILNANKDTIEGFTGLTNMGSNYNSVVNTPYIDKNGNIRELILLWASKKLIYKVKYYDDETGEVLYDYRDETYIANEEKGEEVEELWITQWFEGVQLGEDIYPFIRPRRLQFNKLNDPFYNHPGIVGQIYNTGGEKARSLMDRAFPYQLIYDVNWRKLTSALAKFKGSLLVIDKAKMPSGWDINKMLYFAEKAGIIVEDSFKEGNKGAAQGKLAGGLSSSGRVVDQNLGDYIQQTINLLEFIEIRTGRLLGVTPQRLGEVSNRETVGGVERAVTQSSFNTNEMYKIHDNVKKRVLTLLMELCKVAYKDNPQAFQYIGDDYQSQLFDIDDELLEESYGILIDDDNSITNLEQKMEGLLQAAIQGQTIKFSDAIKFYTTTSMSEKMRIIEYSEDEAEKRREAEQQQNAQIEQERTQTMQQIANMQDARQQEEFEKGQELEYYKIDQQELTKRLKLEVDANSLLDPAEDQLYRLKEEELLIKMKDLDERIRSNKRNENLKDKEISIKKANNNKGTTTKK